MLGLSLPADLLQLPPALHQPTLRALCGAYARLLQEDVQEGLVQGEECDFSK